MVVATVVVVVVVMMGKSARRGESEGKEELDIK